MSRIFSPKREDVTGQMKKTERTFIVRTVADVIWVIDCRECSMDVKGVKMWTVSVQWRR
jgi:hypothetical protein